MITLGIDEAGKGCIIGPLVMAGVIVKDDAVLKNVLVKDSKLMTPQQRESSYEQLIKIVDDYVVVKVSPEDIDHGLRTSNLNWLEADKNVFIIKKTSPDRVIIDCPSPNIRAYGEYVYERVGKKTEIVCAHKADAKYPVVSAASIIAKVVRDREIEKIKDEIGEDFGSGYLSDEKTQIFMKKHWKTYAHIFRKTWKPYKAVVSAQEQKSLMDF
jgi:ribonuclease HII